ncbi:MAG: T9SS type A sorting domain-containing protein [Bacteroidota bacterium]|nr:T9SS type A sorting domain-containing protein [Bacteroidota bacterium]
MKKIILSLLAVYSFVILQMNTADAGDRKVLVERFTSSTCPPCATYNPILEAFINLSDPNKLAHISYHMNWPAPGNDPMYLINPSDNNARRTLFGVNSIPNWFFDGVVNIQIPSGSLQAAFDQRTNILSPVTIIVKETVSGDNVTVKADIYCEGFLPNPNVTIQFAVIEEVVYYNGTNGESFYNGVMRRFLPNANGTAVTLLPGDRIILEYSYVKDPAWNPALIKNLVFVQASPIEILNCANQTTNFNLISGPAVKVINQGQAGSGTFHATIPSVADGFNSAVTFTAEVEPATSGFDVVFTGGNTISNFPDSLAVNVTSTSSVPTGEYKIIFTGTSASGITHKTFVNYLVGKSYITVGTSRGNQLTYKVDNIPFNSGRAFVWDLNSTHVIEAVSPQTFGNNRYVFDNWTNGGTQTQTITIGTTLSDYTANYRLQYRLLGSVAPAGIPVTVVGAGNFYDSASTNNVTVSATQVQFNGMTYYFNRWEGTGSGSYSGTNQVAQITMNGFILQRAVFDTINVGISNYNSVIPDNFALYQNFPNPFNPTTSIKFDIAKSSFTSIKIYDMLGKEISNLVNQELTPGSYQFTLDAASFPSGIYYYKIETESFTEIKKMVLLK